MNNAKAGSYGACVAIFLGLAAPAFGDIPMQFAIKDAETGAVLFRGTEQRESEAPGAALTTVYLDAGDRVAATERYWEDGGKIAEYSFQDRRTGEEARVSRRDNVSLTVAYRAAKDAGLRTGDLPLTGETLSGKALVPLILSHWEELVGGGLVKCDLIVAERLETFKFDVRRAASRSAGDDRVRFEAVASNFFIRIFAPKIAFAFGADRRFAEYEGPSPLAIGTERHRSVRIVYEPVAH